MMRSLLSLFLVLSFTIVRAQSYIPFPSQMVIYGYSHVQMSMGTTYWNPHRTEINGDTLIGSYHYAIVYSDFPSVTRGGVRNDTLNKKVYFYSFSSGTEKVMYDFGLSLGDTVNAASGYGFYDQLIITELPPIAKLDTAWVTSIDSVLMPHDGLYHKRFRFNGIYQGALSSSLVDTTDYFWMQPSGGSGSMIMTSLIEGVGQMYNPISNFGEFEYVNDFYVWCASISGIPVVTPGGAAPPFLNNTYCDYLYLGLKEHPDPEIELFPNPSAGKLYIKTSLKIQYIEVLDVTGRKAMRLDSEEIHDEMDIQKLVPGVYFIRIMDSDGSMFEKKLIKL